jgi:small-conductance mechanosensitive channel
VNVFDRFIHGAQHFFPILPGLIITLLIGAVIIRIVLWFIRHGLRVIKLPAGLSGILYSLIAVLAWITLIVIVFSSYGFGRFAIYLSGSTAILLFILSAGASGLVSDVISGLFLSGDRDFKVGMTVRAGDKQTEGVLSSMDMRKVRVKDTDGKMHIIPNSLVEKNEWIVVERSRKKS